MFRLSSAKILHERQNNIKEGEIFSFFKYGSEISVGCTNKSYVIIFDFRKHTLEDCENHPVFFRKMEHVKFFSTPPIGGEQQHGEHYDVTSDGSQCAPLSLTRYHCCGRTRILHPSGIVHLPHPQ
jgi:hypothetical protein